MNINKKIAVIGLGYVGLPLAIEFSKYFFTIGYDKDKNRLKNLNDGYDATGEVGQKDLTNTKLKFAESKKEIANCDIYIITVPTPVDKFNVPDMSALNSATELVASVLQKGNLVIYESTVYPGATEEFCVPILEEKSGLVYNKSFSCGYSPERINPGDKKHKLTSIKKVTSGSNTKSAKLVDDLYKKIIPAGTHLASSIPIAEAAKVIENIQRDVNIALINELSIIFNKMNLDTKEILDAASTKWNFIPFKPGLVGGHCIGVDPYYLTFKAASIGYHPEMILAGRRINEGVSKFIAENTINEMVKKTINPMNSRVGMLGITFKEDCPDLRNTKVPDIIKFLKSYGCEIIVSDYFADPNEAKRYYNIELSDISEMQNLDAIIVTVSHASYLKMKKLEWEKMLKSNGVVIDVKSIFSRGFFADTNISHWRM